MPNLSISKITLPSGNTYELKDAVARQMIAGGISFVVCWDGESAPDVTKIPAGVKVVYNETEYVGTMAASTAAAMTFYLIKSATQESENDYYDEYVVIKFGAGTESDPFVYSWEKLGDTRIDLSDLGDLAYLDNVTLSKGEGANVLGANTTISASSSAVSFEAHTTKSVLGADATFSTSVTPATTNIKATASGAAISTSGDTFVKSYPGASSKLATTSIKGVAGTEKADKISDKVSKKLATTSVPNVTSVGAAATWNFAMGTDANAETLIISGGNGSAPTLGSAITAATGSLVSTSETDNVGGEVVSSFVATEKTLATAAASDTTVATGSLDANGEGDAVMTGLGTAVTGDALTSASVSAQPTIALETGATAGEGVVSVATGITSASTSVNNSDAANAITGLGAATAAAQTISVASDDTVKVAEYDDLSVSAS